MEAKRKDAKTQRRREPKFAIINALLRLDGVTGEVRPPFERPRRDMDFFVMELPQYKDVEAWCAHATSLIERQRGYLDQQRREGSVS
jgi:hypothetical protein